MIRRSIARLLHFGVPVLAVLAFAPPLAAAEPLRFAPLPRESAEVVLRQFLPMTEYLEQHLGRSIEYVYFDHYDEILQAFGAGEVDLAYLGPLGYVRLRDSYSIADLVVQFNEAHGDPHYRCVLVAAAGETVRDVTGASATVALTQPLSTCGYLGTDALLEEAGSAGLAARDYRYLGSHDAVALAVVAGEFEFGGMKDSIAHRYEAVGLDVVAETAPIMPGHVLAANSGTLSTEVREQIGRLLRDAPPAVYSEWGEPTRYGAVAVEDADYDVIRRMGGLGPIPGKASLL